jgi:GIY-YIG catalytic domain.
MKWHVYSLNDPDTGVVRYVGISKNPSSRLRFHCSPKAAPLIKSWVLTLNRAPDLNILSSFDNEIVALSEEYRLVEEHSTSGYLLNERTGGAQARTGIRKFKGFPDRMSKLMKRRRISRDDLKQICCFTESRMRTIEHDSHEKPIRLTEAVLIARALSTTVEYLATGECYP